MAPPKVFQIVFSRTQPVYRPGENVDGYVELETTEEIPTRGISVELKGTSTVKWTEDKETHRGYECYIDTVINLFGSGSGQTDNETSVKPGSYRFPFIFPIPDTCPSSFESKTGHVRYVIRAVIDRPWKLNHKSSCVITILRDLDLNEIHSARQPVHEEAEDTSCCCCCMAGPVAIKLDLDRKGYVPGEGIPVKAEVYNKGKKSFKRVRADILMRTRYLADDGKTRIFDKIIAKNFHGKLKPGDIDVWNREPILIPPVPPSYLLGCSIIEIAYKLRISVGIFIHVPVEVIIGTIPLSLGEDQQSTTTEISTATYGDYTLGAFSVPLSDGKKGKKNTEEEAKYTPVYSYYDFSKNYHTYN